MLMCPPSRRTELTSRHSFADIFDPAKLTAVEVGPKVRLRGCRLLFASKMTLTAHSVPYLRRKHTTTECSLSTTGFVCLRGEDRSGPLLS